jgi:CelD/BcsL family acetyltransferase involved in cellulose biosynthesis
MAAPVPRRLSPILAINPSKTSPRHCGASKSREPELAPQVTIIRSEREISATRSLWERLYREGNYTVFQDFFWNLLASTAFPGRESPTVICAQASYGAAILPAVLRSDHQSLGLLGEELFDYRTCLHCGEPEVLACALAELARFQLPLRFVARESDCHSALGDMVVERFSAAPAVHCADISSADFEARHRRLARNFRRLARLGFSLKSYDGSQTGLIRSVYQRKAARDPDSLFHDGLRIDFLVDAARIDPSAFEIFTLENGSSLGAALVTIRDRGWRRFYTGWFDPGLEKHSPGMVLIFEVTRRSLEAGIHCDYMTGEQPYKMHLATRSETLYRLSATAGQLSALGRIDQRLSA